jgi:methionyl-tRNA formyltransferase
MKVVILTSSRRGIASHHLQSILKNEDVSDILVVLSAGEVTNKWSFYKRKIRKMFQIGLRGTWNGIQMRSWYNEDIEQHCEGISDIDIFCDKHDVKLIEVPRINCAETRQAFEQFEPSIGISLGNGYIGSKVFNIPTHGMLNIHHEVLPDYQNAQSVIWQLYNMSTETGYTIHQIDKKIDTGKILHQEQLPIQFCDTLSETVSVTIAKCYDMSASGLNEVLSNLQLKLSNATAQGKGGHYTTPTWKQMKRIQANYSELKATSARD